MRAAFYPLAHLLPKEKGFRELSETTPARRTWTHDPPLRDRRVSVGEIFCKPESILRLCGFSRVERALPEATPRTLVRYLPDACPEEVGSQEGFP